MEIKFTSDGKKVAVLGKLNSEQFIVQEIFITNGAEVPSGENFVVYSLHDAPAESWKAKEIRRLEERFEKRSAEIKAALKEMDRAFVVAKQKASHRASTLLSFAKNSTESQLQTLHHFLAGEITHFFIKCSWSPEIVDWDSNKLYDTDSWHGRLSNDGIKLVSLVGKSNGDLSYRLNQYCDGSGGTPAEIIPCRSYEEALEAAQEHLNSVAEKYVSGDISRLNIDNWLKIEGIRIPSDAKEKRDAELLANHQKELSSLKSKMSDIEGAIKKLRPVETEEK